MAGIFSPCSLQLLHPVSNKHSLDGRSGWWCQPATHGFTLGAEWSEGQPFACAHLITCGGTNGRTKHIASQGQPLARVIRLQSDNENCPMN